MFYSIAIDGPAGSGKSTIAKKLAENLGFTYIDTGAMYRAVAVFIIDAGISPDSEEEIKKAIADISMSVMHENGKQQIYLNGENVTQSLRLEETGRAASQVAKYPAVREKLVALQRELAASSSVIMDGRDIGTAVLPGAFLKIFMTASPEIRAKRRFDELTQKGEPCDYEKILNGIRERDRADETRKVSPLKPAEDAVLIDTSDLNEDEVLNKIKSLFEEKSNTIRN